MFSVDKLKAGLNTKTIGNKIVYLEETDSTNLDAWENYSYSEGTIWITDNQIKGRGRRHNKWLSAKTKSLTFSFILKPKIKLDQLSLLPLLVGVSIIEGIYESTFIQAGLKWPNDIMLNKKKMGGILVESKIISDTLVLVVGIGLNINESVKDISMHNLNTSTSLNVYSKEFQNRELILSEILNRFEILYNDGWNSVVPKWINYCIHNGSVVSFNTDNGKHNGIFKGITEDGQAEIQINDKIENFLAGVISI
tara:strand:- start:628 stop:1383 length:756 start_codon:yes stop_codon:yes gene_type:complete